jgi:prepilin-type N-terminal cleavage/methylation domain-containing protein
VRTERTHPGYREFARRDGFTLLELIISVALFSIIAGAIGASILLAASAVPRKNVLKAPALEAAELAGRIASELTYATSITQRSDKLITFTVADRNGDSSPEIIEYEWSGAGGNCLSRRYNNGPDALVSMDVREFCLSYTDQTRGSGTNTRTAVTGVEILLRCGAGADGRQITAVRLMAEPSIP